MALDICNLFVVQLGDIKRQYCIRWIYKLDARIYSKRPKSKIKMSPTRSRRKVVQSYTNQMQRSKDNDLHPRERLHVPSVINGTTSDSMAERYDIKKFKKKNVGLYSRTLFVLACPSQCYPVF